MSKKAVILRGYVEPIFVKMKQAFQTRIPFKDSKKQNRNET